MDFMPQLLYAYLTGLWQFRNNLSPYVTNFILTYNKAIIGVFAVFEA